MNKDLNKLIDKYINEAKECIELQDDNKSRDYFWRMMAGMEKQPSWEFYSSSIWHSKNGDGSHLAEIPKVIEALNSYKIARQFEYDQIRLYGLPSNQQRISIEQHNFQQQSQLQSLSVSFEHAISWASNSR